jgi:hypothetical protein
MPQHVCSGAMLQCSFGVAPSTLNVLPLNRVMTSYMPAANIMDHKPMVNIMPFGMCTTPSNPMVAAATTAALGVLTPVPCMPMTSSPGMPGVATVMLGGQPSVDSNCKLMCNWGGSIQVTYPGQVTEQIP